MSRKPEVSTFDVQPQAPAPNLITEIPKEPIEIVEPNAAAPSDLEFTKFMEEEVLIEVPESPIEGELKVVTVNCNGRNMPIVRGVPTRVKRKYVEILARAKQVTYTQQTPNPMLPEQIQMVPKVTYSYPFSVLSDPNPNGGAWLRKIMQEQA